MTKKKKPVAVALRGTVIQKIDGSVIITAVPMKTCIDAIEKATHVIIVAMYSYNKDTQEMTFLGKQLGVMLNQIDTISEMSYKAYPV